MTDKSATPENIVWHNHHISKLQRSEVKQQKPCVLWFTGLSGSGKSTVANALESYLFEQVHHTYLLDGDNVRHGLNRDLGFSSEDRVENIRRIGEVSKLFVDAGVIVLTAFISPFRADRDMVRELLEAGEFVEVYVSASIEVCEQRDPKGLYKKAREGKIPNFTGIDSPYEAPVNPEIEVNTGELSLEACVGKIVGYLQDKGYIFASK